MLNLLIDVGRADVGKDGRFIPFYYDESKEGYVQLVADSSISTSPPHWRIEVYLEDTQKVLTALIKYNP